MNVQLEWTGGEREISCRDLATVLAALETDLADAPEMVDLVAATGAVLTIGLGAEASVLSFAATPERPPYYASDGDADMVGSIWFSYQGSPSEFPGDQVVPTTTAMAAALEFCQTGQLPRAVRWKAV